MALSAHTRHYLADLDVNLQADSLERLKQLQSRHIAKYSFNSLAVVLSQDIFIDSDSVYRKIVEQGLGGYCFEHNKLVYDVLIELDYTARIALARVTYNKAIDVPRTHRVTIVSLGGEDYLVDAGFGYASPFFPIKLVAGEEQAQGDSRYRICETPEGGYGLQLFKEGEFVTLYTFDNGQYTEADCLAGHFYSHKYPSAGFVNNLVVSRRYHSHTHSLRNAEFQIITHQSTTIEKITTIDELHHILTRIFELPVDRAVTAFLFDKYVTPNGFNQPASSRQNPEAL